LFARAKEALSLVMKKRSETPTYCISLLAKIISLWVGYFTMLSKTELLPARDRLKEADCHLAYVKGSLKQIKSVEDKRIVNDLVGAIEAQRKAVEQMLQVLDTVARCDYGVPPVQDADRQSPYLRAMRERKNSRLRRNAGGSAQGYLETSLEEMLGPAAQAAG
jgi:hypothetical protein